MSGQAGAPWKREHIPGAESPLDRYAIFNAITLLGSPVTLAVLALGVGLLLAARRQWILLGGWLAAFAGGGLLNEVLKLVIRRPRPPFAAAFLHHHSWSFPNGHAMGSLVCYGMLAYVLGVLWIPRRNTQISVALGVALLIAMSQVSRNSRAFFTNASWYWKMPPCPASS